MINGEIFMNNNDKDVEKEKEKDIGNKKNVENENLVMYVDKFLYYEEVILGKSFNTIRGYRRDLLQFMEYLDEYEKIHNFEEIEMMTFRSFIAYLNSPKRLMENDKNKTENSENLKSIKNLKKCKKKAKPKPVSKRSINRKISALRTFFKYLQEINEVHSNTAAQ